MLYKNLLNNNSYHHQHHHLPGLTEAFATFRGEQFPIQQANKML